MNKDEIFKAVQTYLDKPPLVIWGSGATIDFGLPSMSQLKDEIGRSVPIFDKSCADLEVELGKEKYEAELPRIRKIIREAVCEYDIKAKEQLLKRAEDFDGILRMTKFCYDPHPKAMNVVSTNYDRILEYVWGYNGFHFTDGFEQSELSVFNEGLFKEKEIINLMKVHGSLDWFNIDHEIRKSYTDFGYDPVMIPPGKNKYRTTHLSPYRDLMQKSDDAIKKAPAFLVVGFGFNDEHITPLVSKKTRSGTPIVIVTKNVTNTTEEQLEKARKVIYIESDTNPDKSRVKIVDNGNVVSDSIEDGQLWRLNKFMDILK